jgi:hypothetical protein
MTTRAQYRLPESQLDLGPEATGFDSSSTRDKVAFSALRGCGIDRAKNTHLSNGDWVALFDLSFFPPAPVTDELTDEQKRAVQEDNKDRYWQAPNQALKDVISKVPRRVEYIISQQDAPIVEEIRAAFMLGSKGAFQSVMAGIARRIYSGELSQQNGEKLLGLVEKVMARIKD